MLLVSFVQTAQILACMKTKCHQHEFPSWPWYLRPHCTWTVLGIENSASYQCSRWFLSASTRIFYLHPLCHKLALLPASLPRLESPGLEDHHGVTLTTSACPSSLHGSRRWWYRWTWFSARNLLSTPKWCSRPQSLLLVSPFGSPHETVPDLHEPPVLTCVRSHDAALLSSSVHSCQYRSTASAPACALPSVDPVAPFQLPLVLPRTSSTSTIRSSVIQWFRSASFRRTCRNRRLCLVPFSSSSSTPLHQTLQR